MTSPPTTTVLAAAIAICAACRPEPQATTADVPDSLPRVVLETTAGRIVLELDRSKAPATVRHFLKHVRSHFYDSVIFHRVVPGFVVQAGGYMADLRERRTSSYPVTNENPTGLKNLRGAVAMARTADPHSALVDFFINLADNPKLDFTDSTVEGFGYAVFGRVVQGMDVVDSIARIPTRPRGRLANLPTTPVIITRAYIEGEQP